MYKVPPWLKPKYLPRYVKVLMFSLQWSIPFISSRDERDQTGRTRTDPERYLSGSPS